MEGAVARVRELGGGEEMDIEGSGESQARFGIAQHEIDSLKKH